MLTGYAQLSTGYKHVIYVLKLKFALMSIQASLLGVIYLWINMCVSLCVELWESVLFCDSVALLLKAMCLL